MTTAEPLNRYFEAVNASYDAIVDAAQSGGSRGSAVWTRLVEDARVAQKDAIALGERVLTNPPDPLTYGALLEVTMKSQERALGFAKVLFEETSASSSEARAAFERVIAANRTVAEVGAEVARTWGGDNSFAEAWKKGVEAMTAASPFAATR